MKLVTFNSADAYLLDDLPDFSGMELRADLPIDAEGGTTGRETRVPIGDSLRLGLRYTAVLQEHTIPALRTALQALANTPVLCPLWPAGFAAGESPVVEAAFYALIDDDAAPEIVAHADLPYDRTAYPLMVGALDNPPDPTLIKDDAAFVNFDFFENDAMTVTFPASSPAAGPDDGDGNPRPLFPFRPFWATKPKGSRIYTDIDRQTIGAGRQTADAYFAQPARAESQQAFLLQGNEPWDLLDFFADVRAIADSFWLPACMSETKLTANVAALDDTLAVENGTLIGTNYCVLLDDLVNRKAVRVTDSDALSLTLSAAVGTAFTAADTRIESLVLSRFRTASITLKFRAPELAQVSLSFRGVPWEESSTAGETIGETIGGLPTSAYLYEFRIEYPGATTYFRYTDFERALTYSAHTFASKPIEHGDIRSTDSLEREETTLKARMFSGNPLALFLPFVLEWPLMVDIYAVEVDGDDAVNAQRIFRGEVTELTNVTPPMIEASAQPLGRLLDRQIPRRLVQPGCNWALFETGCGLDKADWTWEGTVTGYTSGTLAIALSGVARVSGTAVLLEADYFAGGYLVIGTGANAQYRMIASNTLAVAGVMTLHVASPFSTDPAVSDTVTFYPGCDGKFRTCRFKFDNRARFGGFPYVPGNNPSGARVTIPISEGGKK